LDSIGFYFKILFELILITDMPTSFKQWSRLATVWTFYRIR